MSAKHAKHAKRSRRKLKNVLQLIRPEPFDPRALQQECEQIIREINRTEEQVDPLKKIIVLKREQRN